MRSFTSDQRRALLALIAGQVCLHSALAGLRMGLPLLVLRQGGGALPAEAAAGLLLGLFAAAPVLTAMPSGRWVDRRGYHKPVRAAVGLVLLGALLASVAAGLSGWLRDGLLAVAAALAGSGNNLGLITIQRSAGRIVASGAGAADQGALLRKVFSWLGLAPSLSNAAGPLLAGVLIDRAGFGAACFGLALLPLGTLLCARWLPAALVAGDAVSGAVRRAGSTWRGVRELLALPGMRALLAMNWLFSMCWDLHTFAVPLIGHQAGMSAAQIGSVLGVFSLAVTGVRLLLPLLAAQLDEHRSLAGAMLVAALAFALYPWAQGVVAMAACAVPLGCALGTVQPVIMSRLHHLVPVARQGEALALRSALINLSSACMPLGFGLLGGVLGAAVLFRGMALVLLAGTALPWRQAQRERELR